jgi:hypothetical protein
MLHVEHVRMRGAMRLCSVTFAAIVGGCYHGSDATPASGGTADAGDPPPGGSDAESSDDGSTPAGACADAPLGVTPLRRLTANEYRNTVADLFDIEPPAIEALPTDMRVHDFRTTANQVLSAGTAAKYFEAAKLVVEARDDAAPGWFPCEQDDACVDEWLATEGLRIFRRPLSDDEVAHYHALFSGELEAGDAVPEAATTMLQAMLVSPHFLYLQQPAGEPGERVALDDWQIAARLSYLVWASTPDDALLAAAADGALSTPEARTEQAQRLLEDPRAKAAVDEFFMQWFAAEDISTVIKDPALYPEVVPELTLALEEESRLFFREVFWNRGAAIDELFISTTKVRNAALAAYYDDGSVPTDQTELTVVEGEIDERSFGLLSQAGLLMSIARNESTQIIYRGKFIRNKLLCQHITPPMAGTVPPLPEIDPEATTREQVSQHTAANECSACHALLNPPGFALEHFDTIGLWRDDERGLPIDASAELVGVGIDAPVDGALALSRALADNDTVRECAVAQMFEFAIGREPESDDACVTDDLYASFVDSGGDLQALLVDIVASEAFAERVAGEE